MNFQADADACEPQWLDMLTDILKHIATHPNASHNHIRSQILPALKYINHNDFARACGKVYRDDGSPFENNETLAFLCAAKLARACSPMEDRVKSPLLLLAVRKFSEQSSQTPPNELLSHQVPIVRAQMIRSLWGWKQATVRPLRKDAIARRLPGLDYRSINYRLSTETAKPPEKSMLGKLLASIVRNIESSVDQIAALSVDTGISGGGAGGGLAGTVRGWFKRLHSPTKKKSKRRREGAAQPIDTADTTNVVALSRKELSIKILNHALNNVEELCYSIEVSLSLLRRHVPLVCTVVDNERIAKTVASCVNKSYGVMPSSLIREGLVVLGQLTHVFRQRNTKTKQHNRHFKMDERKENAIALMVNAVRVHLVNVEVDVVVERGGVVEVGDAKDGKDGGGVEEEEGKEEPGKDQIAAAAAAAALSHRENIVHRRLAIAVVTASGLTGVSPSFEWCVNDVCKLLLDPDTSVALAALECVQKMAGIDAAAPCHALCSMLSGMNEHGNRSAIAILIAIGTLKSTAAEHVSKDLIALITQDYNNEDEEGQKSGGGGDDDGTTDGAVKNIEQATIPVTDSNRQKYKIHYSSDKVYVGATLKKVQRLDGTFHRATVVAINEDNTLELEFDEDPSSPETSSTPSTPKPPPPRSKDELRCVAVQTLIAVCSEEVSTIGFEAPLIQLFQLILSQPHELPRIRSMVLSSLSTLLGPAAIRFSKYFVRNLIDHDAETRRVALVAIQSLGPAAKRFYPQLIARLEDEESHLRYLASATLACTFPPAAASRLIVHKMEEGGGGKKKKKPFQKHSTTTTAADLKKRTNIKVQRLPTKVKEVYVNALSKLLTGSHRKYAKEFLAQIVHWSTDIRSSMVRQSSLQLLLDVFCGENCDTRLLHPFGKTFMLRIEENIEDRPEIRIAALRLLKHCTNRSNVVEHIDNVCKCLKDSQSAVREATINVIEAMYPEHRLFEQNLLQQLKDLKTNHQALIDDAQVKYKKKQQRFRKRRGKHAAIVGQLRKRLRREILQLHNKIKQYETDITAQMQKYQHLVELMRRERISRQYQQHNDEVALHDARTALVDSDASDSDSDDPDRPSATRIVQAMMEREENEKRRERERGVLLTNCRVLERKLRAEKDVVLERMDACHRELKGGEQDFYDKVHRLDREIKDAAKEIVEVAQMVGEDLLVEKNRQLTTIHYHERYRRTVVKHIGRHGEQERNARKLKEQTRSKHLPPLPVTPRLTNIYSDEIRLSAIHALRKCHTQWEGTYYSTEVDIVCANDEPNTQIRGAAIELMTYVSSPDDAFKYAPMVLHSLQSQCSVLRTGATAGARALGAVPLQQAAKFTRAFQGGFGPTVLRKGQVAPKIGGYQKRDKYVEPGKLRQVGDLLEIFKLMDVDGNGVLDKKEVMTAIRGDTLCRRMIQEHPTLKIMLRDELWTEKVFAACDTDVSGSVDFNEFTQFVVRAMAGADPVVSGVSIDLNRHLLLKAPPGKLKVGGGSKEEEEHERKHYLSPYDPENHKERDRELKRLEKGIVQSSGSGGQQEAQKQKKIKVKQQKRMTRVRRQAMNAVHQSAAIIQGLYRGRRARKLYEEHVDAHFDHVVEKLIGELMGGEADEGGEGGESGEREQEMNRWMDCDPDVKETAEHAATVIQATMRGCIARSGIENIVDAKIDEIVDEMMKDELRSNAENEKSQ